jgi:hypothetical protein
MINILKPSHKYILFTLRLDFYTNKNNGDH